MADAREHRNRHRRDRPRDQLRVEGRQVGARSPTPHEHDNVDSEARQLAQRPLHPARGAVALHPHVDDDEAPRVAAALELVDEVVVRGAAATGDDADAQRHHRERQARVGVEQPVGRDRAQHPLARHRDAADREDRVDRRHAELQPATCGVELDAAPDADLDVVGKLGAGHRRQRPFDATPVVAPEDDVEAGVHPVAAPALLDQREVRVAGCDALQALHLAPDPHVVSERRLHGLPETGVELTDRERRVGLTVAQVERRLLHARRLRGVTCGR